MAASIIIMIQNKTQALCPSQSTDLRAEMACKQEMVIRGCGTQNGVLRGRVFDHNVVRLSVVISQVQCVFRWTVSFLRAEASSDPTLG